MVYLEQESKYPKTTELIFSSCAVRLKQRKRDLGMTDTEIAGESFDRKVVNRILNNTRTRNNPYLIPPAYTNLLAEQLKLTDARELFWGYPNDVSFTESMFCCLIDDIYNLSDDSRKFVSKVLIDDVRYAKAVIVSSDYEWEDEYGEYWPLSPVAVVNREDQIADHERDAIRKNAVTRLFMNTKPLEMFGEFFAAKNSRGENRGFSKLENRLEGFVDDAIIPFLKANIPVENSLGLRAFSIASKDIANHVSWGFWNDTLDSEGFDRGSSPEYDDFMLELMTAGRDYINQLEKLQGRMDILLRKGELKLRW